MPAQESVCLPYDIHELIIETAKANALNRFSLDTRASKVGGINKKDLKMELNSLLAIASSSKMGHQLLGSSAPFWTQLLEAYADSTSAGTKKNAIREAIGEVRRGAVDAKRALSLVAATGCQMCAASGIRKVYWPFKRRLCRACLYESTVCHYTLEKKYGITAEEVAGLAHTRRETYARRLGSYELRFYWIDDVMPVYNARFGTSYRSLKAVHEAREAARLSRMAEFARSVIDGSIDPETLYANSKAFRDAVDDKQQNGDLETFVRDYRGKVTSQHVMAFRKELLASWTKELCDQTSETWKQEKGFDSAPRDLASKVQQYALETCGIRKQIGQMPAQWTREWLDATHGPHVKSMIEEILSCHMQYWERIRKEDEARKRLRDQLRGLTACPTCNRSRPIKSKRPYSEEGLFNHYYSVHVRRQR
jgi:hypothetical protein